MWVKSSLATTPDDTSRVPLIPDGIVQCSERTKVPCMDIRSSRMGLVADGSAIRVVGALRLLKRDADTEFDADREMIDLKRRTGLLHKGTDNAHAEPAALEIEVGRQTLAAVTY